MRCWLDGMVPGIWVVDAWGVGHSFRTYNHAKEVITSEKEDSSMILHLLEQLALGGGARELG
jgi:hypothetical protein